MIVLEWIIDVCSYFQLHPTTTHSAVAYLDRLQPTDKFSRYEWQMVWLLIHTLRTQTHTYIHTHTHTHAHTHTYIYIYIYIYIH